MKKFFCILAVMVFLSINNITYADNNIQSDSNNKIFKVKSGLRSYRGVKSSDEKILIKPIYYDIITDNENYYAITFPQYAVYSLDGKKLLDIPNSSIEYYNGDFAIIHDENGYYLSDSKGKKLSKYYYSMMIEPYFNKVILFYENDENEYAGVINSYGKILISPSIAGNNKPIYAYPTENGGITSVFVNNADFSTKTFFFIDNKGQKTQIDEEAFYKYSNKYVDAQNEYTTYTANWAFDNDSDGAEIIKWGIEEDDNTIIDKKYEKTSVAIGNKKYFGYKSNNLWGVKKFENEETILQPLFDKDIKVVNEYILVNKAPLGIYFDKNFKKLFELNNVELGSKFKDGFAVVHKNDKYKNLYGFINEKGEVVIPCKYQYAENFSEGLASVQNEKGLWGYIDKNGKIVINFKYKYATSFENNTARATTIDERHIKINKEGKEIQ